MARLLERRFPVLMTLRRFAFVNRLLRFLPAFLIALVLLANGCFGESEEQKRLKELSTSQKDLLASSLRETAELKKGAAELNALNEQLRVNIRNVNDQLVDANRAISQLNNRIQALESVYIKTDDAIKAREAEQKKNQGSWTPWIIGGIVILIVLAGLIIWRVIGGTRSEFDEEEDDLGDYDEEGILEDDEDFEDDLDTKKKTDGNKPDGDAPKA